MKRLVCIMLAAALLLVLASCRSTSISSLPPVSSQSEVSSASQTRPQPPPIPEPEPLLQEYLTGLERDEDYNASRRITAVMINNYAGQREQHGMSEADVVFEMLTEGGISRFMCLYSNYERIPVVGPVRSARDQFFQFLLPYQGFYISDGQSQPARQMLSDWEYDDYYMSTAIYGGSTRDENDLTSLAWRDEARIDAGYSYENSEFTDGAHIAAIIEEYKLNDYRTYEGSTIFNFVPYNEAPRIPADGECKDVTVMHSERNYMSYFVYSAAQRRYLMSMYNSYEDEVQPAIDENNLKQLSFENVIVLFAPMQMYPDTILPQFDFGFGGVGYYYSQGHYELIRWSKGSPNEALFLYDFDTGEPLYVNTGKSYVGVVNDLYLRDFAQAMVDGTAGQLINEGFADPTAEDSD